MKFSILTTILTSAMSLLVLAEEPIRVGIIGLDTSHVVAFTKTMNDPKAKGHVPGAKVIAAYKGGSPDIESSISTKVQQVMNQLERKDVFIVYSEEYETCTIKTKEIFGVG